MAAMFFSAYAIKQVKEQYVKCECRRRKKKKREGRATKAEKVIENERDREREKIKPLSKTLWVIYQTVSHTCGLQSSAKTPTHKHTIITLQICHCSTHLKTF